MSTPPEIPDSMYNCNSDAPDYIEGVAAPLEPLEIAAQKIAGHMGCCVDDIDLVRDILNEFAAAVSKNLQEERDQTERKYQMLLQQRYENMEGFRFRGLSYQELTEKLAKFAELEKEIALVKRVLLQHLNDEDFEYSLVGLYTKLTENDHAGKSPR